MAQSHHYTLLLKGLERAVVHCGYFRGSLSCSTGECIFLVFSFKFTNPPLQTIRIYVRCCKMNEIFYVSLAFNAF